MASNRDGGGQQSTAVQSSIITEAVTNLVAAINNSANGSNTPNTTNNPNARTSDNNISSQSELSRLFGRASRRGSQLRKGSKRKAEERSFTRTFCIIARKNDTKPPTVEQKLMLYKAGLQEQPITFQCQDSKEDVDLKIKGVFPQLARINGYEMMVSSHRLLKSASFGACEALQLKTSMGTGKIYIRPVQKNLDLQLNSPSSQVDNTEKCLECNTAVPVSELRKHLNDVHKFSTISDDDDGEDDIPEENTHTDDDDVQLVSEVVTTHDNTTHDDSVVRPRSESPRRLVNMVPSSSYARSIQSNRHTTTEHSSNTEIQPTIPPESNHVAAVDVDGDVNDNEPDLTKPVPGDFKDAEPAVLDHLIQAVRDNITPGNTEPVSILKAYQQLFLMARQLDADENFGVGDGSVSDVIISRKKTIETAAEELQAQPNLRFPLKVQFYAEWAEDTGGPRREFFREAIMDMKEMDILKEEGDHIIIGDKPTLLVKNWFYVAGLIIGLSAIEGGDTNIPFKESILTTESILAHEKQFQKGMKRCGLMQLIQAFPTVKYLFTNPGSGILSVGKFTMLFKPRFSIAGSNNLLFEEKAYQMFISYLREVAGTGRRDFPAIDLQKILSMITGCASIPPMAFSPSPSITFKENMHHYLPTMHTCINQIVLPRITEADLPENVKRAWDWSFTSDTFGAEEGFGQATGEQHEQQQYEQN